MYYYTYILQSQKDKSFYVGYTKDLNSRLKEHNRGKVRYTKGHSPFRIIYYEKFKLKSEAKEREISIKKSKNISRFLDSMGSPAL